MFKVKNQPVNVNFLNELVERLNDTSLPMFNRLEILKELKGKGVEFEVVNIKNKRNSLNLLKGLGVVVKSWTYTNQYEVVTNQGEYTSNNREYLLECIIEWEV